MKNRLLAFICIPALIFIVGFIKPGQTYGESKIMGGGMVGPTTCKACHGKYYESYSGSIHAQKSIPRSPANKYGCESCHGAGGAHVEKSGEKGVGIFIFSKKFEDSRAKSAKCLACHEESSLGFWDLSKHQAAGLSCDSCHTVHSGTKKNLKAKEPELCNICHREIAFQQNKQSHHPIKEGKLKCTSCHDQHGGFGDKMVKANTPNELCYKCHAEKRGPFLWAHPPVEENCLTCHVSHGSNHTKLLTSRVPLLCNSCHGTSGHPAGPYTSYDTFKGSSPSNRMYARSCLNCHSNVHGGMGPIERGKTLVR
jgi:DmsE family decaheme c-type cytochrome